MATQRQYQDIFEKVRSIVNEVDPMGLIGGGAPDDEYDAQVGKIIPFLRKENMSSVAEKIQAIFLQSFGEDTPMKSEAHHDLARKLHDAGLFI